MNYGLADQLKSKERYESERTSVCTGIYKTPINEKVVYLFREFRTLCCGISAG